MGVVLGAIADLECCFRTASYAGDYLADESPIEHRQRDEIVWTKTPHKRTGLKSKTSYTNYRS
jgi:hypothetical protein